jgi:DNA-directed RNA polymerase II subunit RPB2
MTGADLLNTR